MSHFKYVHRRGCRQRCGECGAAEVDGGVGEQRRAADVQHAGCRDAGHTPCMACVRGQGWGAWKGGGGERACRSALREPQACPHRAA
eukprot:152070-Chlamydomonas_euryale.AAC.3